MDPRQRRNRKVPSSRHAALPAASTAARINDLSMPHVESFSYLLDTGIHECVKDLARREMTVASGDTLHFWLESVSVGHPLKTDSTTTEHRVFPRECRERGTSYTIPLRGRVIRRVNDGEPSPHDVFLGDIPVMVRSSHCNLHGLSPRELVDAGEEASGA